MLLRSNGAQVRRASAVTGDPGRGGGFGLGARCAAGQQAAELREQGVVAGLLGEQRGVEFVRLVELAAEGLDGFRGGLRGGRR